MRKHRIDTISLVFGLLFLGLAGWWWLSRMVHLTAASAGWGAAVALIGLGVVGITTAILGGRSRPEEAPGDPADSADV